MNNNKHTRKNTAGKPRNVRNRRPNRDSNGPRPRRVFGNEVIERGIPGFAALRYKARLNYYDNCLIYSGTGTAGTYVLSANGLYDPDITSTGHQPMSFDQLMLSFEHFVVTRSKITAAFRNEVENNKPSVGISLNAGPTAITNFQQLVENGNMVRSNLGQVGSSTSCVTLQLPVNISTYGSVPDLLDNSSYRGSIAANPVEQVYYHISVWNPDNPTVTVSVGVEFFIEFEAWFIEPRKNSVSLNKALHAMILREQKN